MTVGYMIKDLSSKTQRHTAGEPQHPDQGKEYPGLVPDMAVTGRISPITWC